MWKYRHGKLLGINIISEAHVALHTYYITHPSSSGVSWLVFRLTLEKS